MVIVDEELKDVKVRVFQWNEKLFKIEPSHGLFMFRIKLETKEVTKGKDGVVKELVDPTFREYYEVPYVFDLVSWSNKVSTEYLVSQATEDTGISSQDIAARLTKDVSAYLLSCFQVFNVRMRDYTPNPTLVVVVDVYILRTKRINLRKRVYSSAFSQQKVKKQKVVQDPDQYCNVKVDPMKDVKKSDDQEVHRQIYLPSKLSVEELEEIRNLLRTQLEEPERLWLHPIFTSEPEGLIEVEAALQVKEFRDVEEAPVDACSICLDGISQGTTVATTPCKHTFHKDCLFQWLPKTSRCPLCRSFCATFI